MRPTRSRGSPEGGHPVIWDTASPTPLRVAHGDNADIAVDHSYRFRDDVALWRSLG